MSGSSPNKGSFGQGAGQAQFKPSPEVQMAAELRRVNEELSAVFTRIATGQTNALAELYDATSPMIFGLVLQILEDKEIAEEVLLQVYEQAWQRASSLDRSKAAPVTWLTSIARSKSFDRLRSNSPTQPAGNTQNLNESESDAGNEFMPGVRIAVCGAMVSLPLEQREVIELAYYDGLNHGEIAARLDRPEETVRDQMRHGMAKLRELLNQTVERD